MNSIHIYIEVELSQLINNPFRSKPYYKSASVILYKHINALSDFFSIEIY